jgi:nucleoside-diphosphate-sugar epimerase
MKKFKNIIFGSTSSIGIEISKKLKKNETLFTSRKKIIKSNNWIKNDLNKKNFKSFPDKVDKIFFVASPYYLKKNLKDKKKNIYSNELIWLKNCLENIKCKQIIYISSSSVYIKNHPIGKIKLKCEKYIMNTKSLRYQIWRPYNIIGEYDGNSLSDHFHNLLIKKVLINKKKFITLAGNNNDKLGYSSAKKFANILVKKSIQNKNFVLDYRNYNKNKLEEIIIFFLKLFRINIKYRFKHKLRHLNERQIRSINSDENSLSILKKYYNKYKNEKKM